MDKARSLCRCIVRKLNFNHQSDKELTLYISVGFLHFRIKELDTGTLLSYQVGRRGRRVNFTDVINLAVGISLCYVHTASTP